MNHKGLPSFVFSDCNQEVIPVSCNTPRNVGPLCLVITTKKLYPLLAMNPKDVGLLCLVINQEANPASCNELKERCSLVFSICNQEDLLLITITKSRSLEKRFCKNGGKEENRIAQVFVQWTFLDKTSVEQKLLERCWELVLINF